MKNRQYREFCKKYNIKLNAQQDKAVQSVDGANLLIAVPGSGKTTVLITRLGYMILCKNIKPENILALTYTTAAAADMHNRFEMIFGENLASTVTFRTINSIANGIVKLYTQKTGGKAFDLLSDEKQKASILREILIKIREEFPTENDIGQAATTISYIKNMMLSTAEISNLEKNVEKITIIYRMYCEEMIKNKLMDYDDQLIYAYKVLKNPKHKDILNRLQNKFTYICVDEAQDTSKIQHEIISILSRKSGNIFMVGDEDQSIYSFRGAYPSALVNFDKTYKDPNVLFMEENFRSSRQIVDTAATFIDKNTDRYKKQMVANRPAGAKIRKIFADDRIGEYKYVMSIAKKKPKDTALLYRDNDCVLPIIDLFLRNNIPYRINRGKTTFFTHRIVQDIRAFFNLALNPYDTESFMQIYYKCGIPIKKEVAIDVCEYSIAKKMPVTNALDSKLSHTSSRNLADDFRDFITHVNAKTTIKGLETILYNGYGKFIVSRNLDFGKYEILKALAVNEPSIDKFLKRLDELEKLIVSKSEYNNGIILSTIHSSKGLEYDTVYLMDAYNGILPSVDTKDPHYQEERRLFYVAITRAKNNLFVFDVKSKHSPFVEEIFSVKKI